MLCRELDGQGRLCSPRARGRHLVASGPGDRPGGEGHARPRACTWSREKWWARSWGYPDRWKAEGQRVLSRAAHGRLRPVDVPFPLEHGGLRPKALERGGRLGPKCSRTPGLYVVEGKVTCWLGEARWPWERLPGQWTKGASECCAGTLTASGGGIPLEHGTFAHGVPARRPPRWGEVLDPGRPRGRGRSGGHVVGDMLACGRAKGASECCARTVAASGSGVPPRAPELRP